MPPENPFEVVLSLTYPQALEVVSRVLKEEGFGVVTHIDLSTALKKKMNVDFHPYSILGAYNPPIVHRALQHDPRIGLMLPCNISVESLGDRVIVRFADPLDVVSCSALEDETAREIAEEIQQVLLRVAQRLRDGNFVHSDPEKGWKRLNAETLE
ncbi:MULTISPECIES: DUF302 domain-containing protein [Anaerolinea]|jgi:uncharacterized protein (DUF302 family)|uniref:DUF302 domain-containing protein n=1 Tax=Anaerolinea TaxID=233189 RepID=UPI00260CB6AD|nr:DUF302 domain-containing protein [Anaerolinea thermophila]